jgi:hypothetical protein
VADEKRSFGDRQYEESEMGIDFLLLIKNRDVQELLYI